MRQGDATRPNARQARLTEARRLQAILEVRHAAEREERRTREAAARQPLADGLSEAEHAILSALPLVARRYGIARNAHAVLRQMRCASLCDVAEVTRGRAENWLGYATADRLRARLAEILTEIRAGTPEPGITRIGGRLSADAIAWLTGQGLETLTGSGLTRNLIIALRQGGYSDLADLAQAERDAVADLPGFGEARLARLSDAIAAFLDARPRLRSGQDDEAEWEAAAPRPPQP